MNLYNTEKLRESLKLSFANSSDIKIITAFFTSQAADYLIDNVSSNATIKVLVRARADDFIAGSCDIKAIEKLYKAGVSCYLNQNIHAKLYQFDNSYAYIGSANFTTKGLNLYGNGNFEIATKIGMSEFDLTYINTIYSNSLLLKLEYIEKIIDYLSLKDKKNIDFNNKLNVFLNEIWLEHLKRKKGLFVMDLPWCNIGENNDNNDIEHDKTIFSFGCDNHKKIQQAFTSSHVFELLLNELKRNNGEMYFGAITKFIHEKLLDEPVPYRKNVKVLVQNLISYIQVYSSHILKVDRPNYSQRVFLLK